MGLMKETCYIIIDDQSPLCINEGTWGTPTIINGDRLWDIRTKVKNDLWD